MKKIFATIALIALSLSAFAQKSDFAPSWYGYVKGGVGYTVGETTDNNLITPGAALGLGYQMSPVFGLRGDLSGIQGKGYLPTYNEGYAFNYGQLNLDATLDIRNLLGGYKQRVLSPYLLAGIGGNLRFNNSEVNAGHLRADDYYWDKATVSPAGRAGIGIDINVTENLAIVAEVATNLLSDGFNSKNGGAESKFDHQYQALVGLKFAFGKKKVAAPEPEPAPVVKEEPKPEPKPVVKEEPKPEPVVEPEPLYVSDNILFLINKWDIRTSEMPKINEIVKVMNEYPNAKLSIVGHADKDTGTASRNLFLSEKRSQAVLNKLVELGVAKDRITTDFKGDKANQFPTPEGNRVAVCVITE